MWTTLLSFSASNTPEEPTRDDVIIDAQAWSFAFTEDGRIFARDNGCREESVAGYVQGLPSTTRGLSDVTRFPVGGNGSLRSAMRMTNTWRYNDTQTL